MLWANESKVGLWLFVAKPAKLPVAWVLTWAEPNMLPAGGEAAASPPPKGLENDALPKPEGEPNVGAPPNTPPPPNAWPETPGEAVAVVSD